MVFAKSILLWNGSPTTKSDTAQKRGQTGSFCWRHFLRNNILVQPSSSVTPRVSGESLSAGFYQILIFWFFEFLEFCQIHSTGKWISHNQTRHDPESRANQLAARVSRQRFFQSFRVFIAKSFSKLKTNIRNGFPIEFRIDIGVTGSPGRQNSPKPLQLQNMDNFERGLVCLKKITAIFSGVVQVVQPGFLWKISDIHLTSRDFYDTIAGFPSVINPRNERIGTSTYS